MPVSMDWGQLGHAAISALLTLVCNPILYIGTFLMAWDLHRNARMERKFFGIRLSKVAFPVFIRWMQAIVAGIVFSVVAVAAGLVVASWEVWTVTGLSLLLALIRVRWFAPAYAISVLTLLSLGLRLFHVSVTSGVTGRVIEHLEAFQVASWVGIAAVASLLNGTLLWLNHRRAAAPVALLSKRGGTIGAFLVQLAFVIPIVTPAVGHTVALTVHGWPFIGSLAGWAATLVGLPLLVGFSAIDTTVQPATFVKQVAGWNGGLGLLLAASAWLSHLMPVTGGLVGLVVALAGHEVLLLWLNWREARRDPLFVESPEGVRVLTAVKGSLAEAMDLRPGEVITHVNQVPVHSEYDLHFALEQNPAYAKIQVLDARGEIRFVGKPVFSGERNKLGLISAPDTTERVGYRLLKAGLFQTLYARASHEGTRFGGRTESATATEGFDE